MRSDLNGLLNALDQAQLNEHRMLAIALIDVIFRFLEEEAEQDNESADEGPIVIALRP